MLLVQLMKQLCRSSRCWNNYITISTTLLCTQLVPVSVACLVRFIFLLLLCTKTAIWLNFYLRLVLFLQLCHSSRLTGCKVTKKLSTNLSAVTQHRPTRRKLVLHLLTEVRRLWNEFEEVVAWMQVVAWLVNLIIYISIEVRDQDAKMYTASGEL